MSSLGQRSRLSFTLGGYGGGTTTGGGVTSFWRLANSPRGIRFRNAYRGRANTVTTDGVSPSNVHSPVAVMHLPSDKSNLSGVIRRRFYRSSSYLPRSVKLPELRGINSSGEHDFSR